MSAITTRVHGMAQWEPRAATIEGETTQAESLPPDVLAKIVTDAITDRLDPAAYAAALARESAIREGLVVRLDRLLGDDDAEDGT